MASNDENEEMNGQSVEIIEDEIEYEIPNEHLMRPIRTSNNNGLTYKSVPFLICFN
jgi:hypothetical protein